MDATTTSQRTIIKELRKMPFKLSEVGEVVFLTPPAVDAYIT